MLSGNWCLYNRLVDSKTIFHTTLFLLDTVVYTELFFVGFYLSWNPNLTTTDSLSPSEKQSVSSQDSCVMLV